jgi:hypothetical protein
MAVGLSTGSGLAAQAGEHPVDVVLGGEWIPRLGVSRHCGGRCYVHWPRLRRSQWPD